jgi:phosphoribosylglycinamide formyltransferase-1
VSAATKKKRVAVLISGRGSNMLSLMAAARSADYPAEIALVFSNKPDAAGLATAKEAGIATAALFHKDFGSREDFECAMQDILLKHEIDLICLAGFMRLLTPWFVEQWTGRMINIHPAILPSYKGLHTHERALADGVKLHGATVHFVVPEMDAGPIIAQAAVPIVDGDTPETLGARVLTQEHIIYPLALRLVASGEAKLVDGKVLTGETLNEKTLVVPTVL